MSHSQSQHSPAQYPLHATLEVALGSLDVQLEEELARYRRQRTHQHVANAPSPQLDAAIASTAPEPKTSPKAVPPTTHPPANTGENNDIVNLTQPAATQLPSPTDDAPQDYLQSSEALLKNLEQSSPSPTAEPTPEPQFKLTWWHMGTALISGIAVTLLIGLSIRQAQVAQQPSSGDAPTRSSSSESRASDTASASPESREPLDLDGPNLAESDRDETETPPAPPSPASTGSESTASPAASPVLPGREPDLSAILSPTNPQASPVETDEPSDEAENQPDPANVAAGPPANDRFYHVILDYSGESSLTQAQTAVEGVYLRKFPDGIKIQMGAFDSVEGAQTLVNRLKTQGMNAKIYEP